MPFVTGPLPQRLKLVHGFGAVAFGVKDSGFSFFLLPFYNLVLGVDAGTVGAALATAPTTVNASCTRGCATAAL